MTDPVAESPLGSCRSLVARIQLGGERVGGDQRVAFEVGGDYLRWGKRHLRRFELDDDALTVTLLVIILIHLLQVV